MIRLTVLWASLTLMAFIAASALAESKAEKTLSGPDGCGWRRNGIENVIFYW
jgi:hypothetical protein